MGNSHHPPPHRAPSYQNFSFALTSSAPSTSAPAPAASQPTHLYQSLRFVFTKIRGDDPYLQLGHIRFFCRSADGRLAPATPRVVSFKNPSGSSPRGEEPHRLKAVNATKWLDYNFSRNGQSTIQLHFATPFRFDAYAFQTANDFTPRDPSTWQLFGNGPDSGSKWQLIDARAAVSLPLDRWAFSEPFCVDSGIDPSEHPPAAFIDDFGPLTVLSARYGMGSRHTDVTAKTAALVRDDELHIASPYNDLFGDPLPGVVKELVVSYRYSGDPATLTVGEYQQLHIRRPSLLCRKLRFEFSGIRGGDPYIQLAHIRLLCRDKDGGERAVPVSPAGCQVENPSGRSPAGEEPRNLVPQDHSKWLDYEFPNNGRSVIVLHFNTPLLVSGYAFQTANDCLERDPARWQVYRPIEKHSIVHSNSDTNSNSDSDSNSNSHDGWQLLDSRSNISLPHARWSFSEAFIFNMGKECEIASHVSSDDSAVFFSPALLQRTNSKDLRRHWTKPQPQRLPEAYRKLRAEIFLDHQQIMATSKLSRIFAFLDSVLEGDSELSVFMAVLTEAIKKAYPDSQPRHAYDMLENRSLFDHIVRFYNALDHRKRFLHSALRHLVITREGSELIGILSLAARAGAECPARQRMAFYTIVLSVQDQQSQSSSSSTTTSSSSNSTVSSDPVAQHVSQFETDKVIFRQWFESYMDDYKTRAFKSAFLEPSKLYYAFHGSHLDGDVDVHSSNVFASVLLSTLGVVLPLQPYFLDHPYKTAFLQDKELQSFYDLMLLPQNFGREWGAISQIRQHVDSGWGGYGSTSAEFPWHGSSPQDIANNALQTDPTTEAEIVRYLERFVHFFKPEFFLEKAFNEMMGDDGQPIIVNRFFQRFLEDQNIPDREELKDIRHWVYHEDEDFNYHFQPDRCLRILQWLNTSLVVLPDSPSSESPTGLNSAIYHTPEILDADSQRILSREFLRASQEHHFEAETAQLFDLGFTDTSKVLNALRQSAGEVDQAIEILLELE